MTRDRNYHLDLIRALAAFSVLITHMRALFFVPYRDAGTGLFVSIFYVEHYFARAGVIAFFVLSGYLVGTSVLGAIQRDRWSWRDYLIRRLARLEIVLIPALLLTAGSDYLGSHISSIYVETNAAYTWQNFFGCMVFLQQVIGKIEPFGSDGALWSLSYEFWYYLLFPIIALIILRRRNLVVLLPTAAAISWLLFGPILFLFSCWLGGVGAGRLASRYPIKKSVARRVAITISIFGILLVTIGCGAHKLNLNAADAAFGIFTVSLIWACLCVPLTNDRPLYVRGVILASEFSYSLYLTHQPVLQLLKSYWLGAALWSANFPHFMLSAIPFVCAMLFAFVFYLVFESNTDEVRKHICALVDRFVESSRLPSTRRT